MSVGLVRREYANATMTSICTTCGADIVVSTFDGADDFCPSCAMTLIRHLAETADDLGRDVEDLRRETDATLGEDDDPVLFLVTAQRSPRGRERRVRVRRFVVLAQSDSHARLIARELLEDDGWTMKIDRQWVSTVELGAA